MKLCSSCTQTSRSCADCGDEFVGNHKLCRPCRTAAVPEEERRAAWLAQRNARRARLRAVTIDGPVPLSQYRAVRSEGPCVYCGAEATTVDHIVPLSRGGIEHESNLVPACVPCNYSKGKKLLVEWDTVKVQRAVQVSPIVAEVWNRLTAEA